MNLAQLAIDDLAPLITQHAAGLGIGLNDAILIGIDNDNCVGGAPESKTKMRFAATQPRCFPR